MATLFKPWRAHSELDGLSDAECMEMVERKWRRDPPPLRLIPVAAVFAAIVWAAVVAAYAVQSGVTESSESDEVSVWTWLVLAAVGGGAALAAITARLLRWGMIRATVRRIVLGAICPRCGHSLIGLRIYDDATRPGDQSRMRVRCPECGKVVRLLKHGYSAVDFAPWSERVLPKDFEVRLRR